MPRINLLPAKKMARQEELRTEVRSLGYLSGGMVLCMVAHAFAQSGQIERKQNQIAEVNAASERIAGRLKELEELKSGLGLLSKKLAVIDELAAGSRGPSLVLGTFAEVLSGHPRVWLSKFEQAGDTVRLTGNAMAQEDISAFQQELSKKAPIVTEVTLLLVNSSKDAGAGSVLEWSMSCKAPTNQAAPANSKPT